MKIEQQVTSLEISKRLQELGVKKESYAVWYKHTDERFKDESPFVAQYPCDFICDEPDVLYSAFTVAELGEMLPCRIKNHYLRTVKGVDEKWAIYYKQFGKEPNIFIEDQSADTEADARGKMLIYLLENKLITL